MKIIRFNERTVFYCLLRTYVLKWGKGGECYLVLFVYEKTGAYCRKLLDPRNDIVFKCLFGHKRNKKLLLTFLNVILSDEIVDIHLSDPHLERLQVEGKGSVLDIRVITNQGEQISIEMQIGKHKALNERMLFYWSRMHASQGEIGKNYDELTRTVQIIITDFEQYEKQYFHSIFRLLDEENGTLFSPHAEIHVLELPKVQQLKPTELTELEQWLLFLKSDEQIKEELAMVNAEIEQALEEIKRLSRDPKTSRLAEAREMFLMDQLQRELDARREGKDEGKEEGKEDAQQEIVLHMHNEEIPPAQIAKLTNIPIAKVIEILAKSTTS